MRILCNLAFSGLFIFVSSLLCLALAYFVIDVFISQCVAFIYNIENIIIIMTEIWRITKSLKRSFDISEEVANAKLALDLLRYSTENEDLAMLGYDSNELRGHLSQGKDLLVSLKENLEMVGEKKTGEIDDAVATLVYSLKNLRETTNRKLLEELEKSISELDMVIKDFSNISDIGVCYEILLDLTSVGSQVSYATSNRLRGHLGAWTTRT